MNRNTANLWLGVIRVLMIAAIPMPSFAQAVESLTAGTRVRIQTASPKEWRVGYIRSVDSSGITAAATSSDEKAVAPTTPLSVWTIPRSSIERVEVSRGSGSKAERTILGALGGGLAGGLILGTVGYFATRCTNCEESGIGLFVGPIFGVPIGVVFGALAGLASARERWEPVSFNGRETR